MKKYSYRFIALMAFSLGFFPKSYAIEEIKDSLRTTYHWDEKWYFQAQLGAGCTVAEEFESVNVDKLIRPVYTFSVGKRFTPLWGARLQFLYGSDRGVCCRSTNGQRGSYPFNHHGVIFEGTFNVANFIRDNYFIDSEKKWNVDLKLGFGYVHSDSYEFPNIVKLNDCCKPAPRYNFSFYGGIDISRKIATNVDLNLELSLQCLDDRFNGLTCTTAPEIGVDFLATSFIGIRYTIPCRQESKKEIVYVYIPTGKTIDKSTNKIIENPRIDTVYVEDDAKYYHIDELVNMINQGSSIKDKKVGDVDAVHFDYDKSDINSDFGSYLDKLAEVMQKSDATLIIMGHTDSKGSDEYNYGLSERRAKSVMDYLNNKGVDYDRMVYSYYGKSNPKTENETDSGRSANRRVEFLVLQ